MDRRLSRATSSSKQNQVKSCPVFYVVIKPRQGQGVTQIASYVGVKGSIKRVRGEETLEWLRPEKT